MKTKKIPLSGMWAEVSPEEWANHVSKFSCYATEIKQCLVHKVKDGDGYKAIGLVMYHPKNKKYFIGDEYPLKDDGEYLGRAVRLHPSCPDLS